MTSDTSSDDFEVLHQGDWLRLVRHGKWEACERTHGGSGMAVLVIAVTPDDEVLFVEQYRVPLGARTIEMPAGLVGDGGSTDSLEDAARRELIEETGWSAGRVDVLLTGPTTAGMSNERVAFVRARELTRVGEGGGVGFVVPDAVKGRKVGAHGGVLAHAGDKIFYNSGAWKWPINNYYSRSTTGRASWDSPKSASQAWICRLQNPD